MQRPIDSPSEAQPPGSALFSVVITTFNRVEILPRAIKSILSQQGVELELIIIDDGSTDQTPSVLKAIADQRVIALHRENGGLGAARNTGIARAAGDWTVFLDDDDVALPGWLAGLAELADADAGVVCCAAEYRTPGGVWLDTCRPVQMGHRFQHQIGLMIAGTFAVRTALLQAVGGYDERLTCSHQTELAMRLIPAMLQRGWHMRYTDRVLASIERRSAEDRPMSSPAALYHGIRILLDTHRQLFDHDARGRAVYNGILGVSAARLGHWPEARSALLASARSDRKNVGRWLRLAAAFCPPIGRRVWRVTRHQPQALEEVIR